MAYEGNKKSMWKMVLMYLIIGLAVYGIVYYFIMMKNGRYQTTTSPTSTTTSQPAAGITITPATGNVTMSKISATSGSYLADLKGMTLYIFDKDTKGVSNCSGNCLVLWPPYTSLSATVSQANMSVITRSDGTYQYAWMGMPLYYYSKDLKATDMTGDNVGGIWHIIKL